MMSTQLISKYCLWKTGFRKRGLSLLFNETKHLKVDNFRAYCFFNKRQSCWASAHPFRSKLMHLEKRLLARNFSAEAPFQKNSDDLKTKSYFQEVMHARKLQAHRSVLVEVTDKEDIPFAVSHLQKYGSIASIYSYPGESKNYYLLIEFSSKPEKLLSNCGYKNIVDVFPVRTRIIRYDRKSNAPAPEVNLNIHEESNAEFSTVPGGANISEVIQDIFSHEKLTELDTRLRFFLCSLIKDSLSGAFEMCDVFPFGSSVNGLGRRGCDLDIVIRLYPEEENGDGEIVFINKTCIGRPKNLQQKALNGLKEFFLFSPGVAIKEIVMFARVPILKMNHKLLKLDYDVSINNMSGVLMSDILHFCGEIDPRVRPLIHAVKKWAKEGNVTADSPGSWITNFGLSNLVLFYLQNLEQPILPPLNDALTIIGSDNSNNYMLQYLKSIEEWRILASSNKASIGVLLKEFLAFLSAYPFDENVVSLLSGRARPREMVEKECTPLHVEYPLDESLNITRNVSRAEYDLMCEKAKISAKSLESNLNIKVSDGKDISALLGIPTVTRIGARNQKFKVSSVIEDEKSSRNRKMKYRM